MLLGMNEDCGICKSRMFLDISEGSFGELSILENQDEKYPFVRFLSS